MSIVSGLRSDKWKTTVAEVAAASFANVDSVPLNLFSPTKYYVEIKSDANDLYKAFELYGSRKGSTDVCDSLYAKIGDAIQTATSLEVTAGTVRLKVVNNESFPVSVKVTKLIS